MSDDTKKTEETTTALVPTTIEAIYDVSIYDRMTASDPLAAIEKLGAWLGKSGMFGVAGPDQGAVVALVCVQERITPFEFKRRYHIIKGSPAPRADWVQARFMQLGGSVEWVRTDDEVCTVRVAHPRVCPQGFTNTVEMKVLRSRGTTQANHDKFPRQMLRARAVMEAIRAIMPGVVSGYAPEELDGVIDAVAVEVPAAAEKKAQRAQQTADRMADEAQLAQRDATPATAAAAPVEGGLSERAKAALAAFKGVGMTQDQAEALAGVPAVDWADGQFKALSEKIREIKKTKPADRKALIEKMLAPPTDAPAEAPAAEPPPAEGGDPGAGA